MVERVEGVIAFRVKGVGITDAQRDAGIRAMYGTFTKNDVRRAMIVAGVPSSVPGEFYLADRAADRLCQAERKAGRVLAINNRTWSRA